MADQVNGAHLRRQVRGHPGTRMRRLHGHGAAIAAYPGARRRARGCDDSHGRARHSARPRRQPHDGLFVLVFGDPVNAASLLRAVLPAELAGQLVWSKLTRANASFVDRRLWQRRPDLVFIVPLVRRGRVCIVLEHQSTDDPYMTVRIAGYTVRILEQDAREQHARRARRNRSDPRSRRGSRRAGRRRPPGVITVVVHNGRRRWTSPVRLADSLDMDQAAVRAAGPGLMQSEFTLVDLATYREQALAAVPLTLAARMTLLVHRNAPGNRRMDADLRRWLSDLRALARNPGGEEVVDAIMEYVLQVSDTPDDKLRDIASQLGPETEDAYMTTAQTLERRGEKRGRAAGREEGLAAGREEGLAEGLGAGRAAVVQLLTFKFGALPQDRYDAVQVASASELQSWIARVPTAQTLDDVFR